VTEDVEIFGDAYLDLAGHTLTGDVTGVGTLYGMDSTTDSYTADDMGRITGSVSCKVAGEFKTDTTGAVHRYMAIADEEGYTFHRFYLGITHVSLAPNVTGFGYRAEFYGDEMVQDQIASIGYNLWLTEDRVVSRTTAFKNVLTLRLKNFDVANYGETPVNACVTMTLTDGTVIESATTSYSMRQVVEQINQSYASFDNAKISAIQAMIANNPVMESWKVENIRKK